MAVVLDRSCSDCHSNNPSWPRWATLLAASCQDATSGTMPGPYALLRPDTKLSPQDIETICAASRQADAGAATAERLRRP